MRLRRKPRGEWAMGKPRAPRPAPMYRKKCRRAHLQSRQGASRIERFGCSLGATLRE